MSNVESIQPYLEPLRKEVVVRRTPQEAFEVFTTKLASWWPLHMFSIYQADAVTCGIEPRVGEHAAELLAELGCSPREIESLRDRGIVALPQSSPP